MSGLDRSGMVHTLLPWEALLMMESPPEAPYMYFENRIPGDVELAPAGRSAPPLGLSMRRSSATSRCR